MILIEENRRSAKRGGLGQFQTRRSLPGVARGGLLEFRPAADLTALVFQNLQEPAGRLGASVTMDLDPGNWSRLLDRHHHLVGDRAILSDTSEPDSAGFRILRQFLRCGGTVEKFTNNFPSAWTADAQCCNCTSTRRRQAGNQRRGEPGCVSAGRRGEPGCVSARR